MALRGKLGGVEIRAMGANGNPRAAKKIAKKAVTKCPG